MVKYIDQRWDLFQDQPYDASTSWENYEALAPQTAIANTKFGSQSQIIFAMTDSGKYVDWSKSYIQMALQILATVTQTASAPLVATTINTLLPSDTIAFIENATAALFQKVIFEFGGNVIEASESATANIALWVRDLIYRDYAQGRSVQPQCMTEMAVYPAQGNQQVLTDAAYLARAAVCTSTNYVNIKIPMKKLFAFCGIPKVLFGANVTVKLFPAQNLPLFRSSTIVDGYIQVNTANLMLCTLRPSVEIQASITEAMNERRVQSYAFESVNTYPQTVPIGNTFNLSLNTTSERLNFLVVTFTPSSYTNTQLCNGWASYVPGPTNAALASTIKSTNISSLYVQYGSVMCPSMALFLQPEDEIRLYEALLQVTHRDDPFSPNTGLVGFQDLFGTVAAGSNTACSSSQYMIGGYFCVVVDLRHVHGDAPANTGAKQVNLKMSLVSATTEAWQVYPTFFSQKNALISARDNQLAITLK